MSSEQPSGMRFVLAELSPGYELPLMLGDQVVQHLISLDGVARILILRGADVPKQAAAA